MEESFDVIIIGAGPAGYVTAIRAAQLGMKTLVIEKEARLGGTCLNIGCIPSKTLLHYSALFHENRKESPQSGISCGDLRFDLSQLMATKKGVVKGLNMGIASLFKKNKIVHRTGNARFLAGDQIEIAEEGGKKVYGGKRIIIATGSAPKSLPDLPFDEKTIVSSTGALSLEKIPEKMVVIGAGVIGLELGSVYHRLGAQVTFIEAASSVGGNLDTEIAAALLKSLTKRGMVFHLGTKLVSAKKDGEKHLLEIESPGKENRTIGADVVLVSVGRKAYTEGLNCEEVGIQKDEFGRIRVNNDFQTALPNVYAVGDVVEGPMLAHKASEEGVALIEKIAGRRSSVNYVTIPNVLYTSPEVATVGFTSAEAEKHGFRPKTGSFPFLANSRAHCVDAKEGLVRIVVDETSDKILGLHIMSEHAGEMIALGALAIEKQVTAKELGALCFPHPTFSEAIKEAALDVHREAIHF